MPALPSVHDDPLHWDLFCRVIDNHGDLGVCWRLTRALAARGHTVRLWVDDPAALRWMAPDMAVTPADDVPSSSSPSSSPGGRVHIHRFDEAERATAADVVVEAFGCDPPEAYLQAMPRETGRAPVWINLEYLSAEAYVERSHGLPSPQHQGPGAGLMKWFFYPGFTDATGGLLRVADCPEGSSRLAALTATLRPGARRITVFCYDRPVLGAWLDKVTAHADEALEILIAPGLPQAAVRTWWTQRNPIAGAPTGFGSDSTCLTFGLVRLHALPYLPQAEFDGLLRSADLNIVRGEDSLVSALQARRPFIWHLYRQDDDAHHAKLDAFLTRYGTPLSPAARDRCRAAHAYWNEIPGAAPGTPREPAAVTRWLDAPLDEITRAADALTRPTDLATSLTRFVRDRRQGPASASG